MGEGPGRAAGPDNPRPLLPAAAPVRQPGRAQRVAGGRVPTLGRASCPSRTRGYYRRRGAGYGATGPAADPGTVRRLRSEEHTSELQSLMRISYAVFCLKKKNNKTKTKHSRKHKHN